MRQWIAGVAAASLLAAIAMALTPPGRVRQVTRLVCGLLCALAVASPILTLDVGRIAAALAAYEQQAEKITADAEQEAKMLDRTYIEQRCAAYILGKAAEGNIAADSVVVTARWDEADLIWYPWSVAVEAPFDKWLSDRIEADLGVPSARQSWRDNG